MNHLQNEIFQDETKARAWLENRLWPHGVVCPHCGTVGTATALQGEAHRAGVYQCNETECREQFTVTVGTVFERSKIPLTKWLMVVFLMAASKKGMSAHQIHRMIGVSYKSTWFMCHRIREAMKSSPNGLLGGGSGIVEADETFTGTKEGATKKRGWGHKNAVFSLVERGGDVRSFHVPNVTAKTLKPILLAQVSAQAKVYTDDFRAYKKAKLARDFDEHQTVNHSAKEYVRGTIHTNTIEGYFSLLKRGIIGTYHHVGSQHLQRYCTEFDFRYNGRKISDVERADLLLKGIQGKRLMYGGPRSI